MAVRPEGAKHLHRPADFRAAPIPSAIRGLLTGLTECHPGQQGVVAKGCASVRGCGWLCSIIRGGRDGRSPKLADHLGASSKIRRWSNTSFGTWDMWRPEPLGRSAHVRLRPAIAAPGGAQGASGVADQGDRGGHHASTR
jgi:hypothetical protein